MLRPSRSRLPSPTRKRYRSHPTSGGIRCRLVPLITAVILVCGGLQMLLNSIVRGEEQRFRATSPPTPSPAPTLPHLQVNAIPDLVCGARWSTSREHFKHAPKRSPENPLFWTLSGGSEYKVHLKSILAQWHTIGITPVVVIALDVDTSIRVCKMGYQSVLWDLPKASYSQVADSKFEVAATFAELGIPSFFMEPDVFCKQSPLPLFLEKTESVDAGIVTSGHGFADFVPNIGQFYVEPLQRTADFFRGLAAVLAFSKKHDSYITHKNRTAKFFDQRIFYLCLPPTNPADANYEEDRKIYLADRPDFDLLTLCRDAVDTEPFPWSTVSNVYINAHDPPTVFESTICVHPLSDSPFSPFRLKLATAKFLGFDPAPIAPTERLLKTITGDFTFNECWSYAFVGDDKFHLDWLTHEKFMNYFSNLVLFAKKSGRTLVLPRYFRDQNAFAIPILSLIDIRTVEDQDVPYRFLPPPDSGHYQQRVVLADGDYDSLLQELESEEPVIAVDRFCEFFNNTYPEAQQIAEKLSHCLKDDRLKFARGIGSWARVCNAVT